MTKILSRAGARRSANPYLIPVLIAGALALIAQTIWLNRNDHLFRPFSLDRIVCDVCGGTGVQRDASDANMLKLCPACFGVGSHMLRRIDTEDHLCPACRGMGRVEDGETSAWRECRRCEGRGLVRETPWTSKKSG